MFYKLGNSSTAVVLCMVFRDCFYRETQNFQFIKCFCFSFFEFPDHSPKWLVPPGVILGLAYAGVARTESRRMNCFKGFFFRQKIVRNSSERLLQLNNGKPVKSAQQKGKSRKLKSCMNINQTTSGFCFVQGDRSNAFHLFTFRVKFTRIKSSFGIDKQ